MSKPFYTERDWGLIDQLKRQRRIESSSQRTVQQKFDVYDDWYSTVIQSRIRQGDRQEQREVRVAEKIKERVALIAWLKRNETP